MRAPVSHPHLFAWLWLRRCGDRPVVGLLQRLDLQYPGDVNEAGVATTHRIRDWDGLEDVVE